MFSRPQDRLLSRHGTAQGAGAFHDSWQLPPKSKVTDNRFSKPRNTFFFPPSRTSPHPYGSTATTSSSLVPYRAFASRYPSLSGCTHRVFIKQNDIYHYRLRDSIGRGFVATKRDLETTFARKRNAGKLYPQSPFLSLSPSCHHIVALVLRSSPFPGLHAIRFLLELRSLLVPPSPLYTMLDRGLIY